LLLEVVILPHRYFKLDGRDVLLDLPLAPWEAALGAVVSTPTLAGPVDVKIPAGARAGQRMRLRGRGFPGEAPGDQYVTLRIAIPAVDTPETKAFYEQMAQRFPAFDPRSDLH
jgi:curved DNA-binding protein